MNPSRKLIIATFSFTFLLWMYFLFQVPTFDLDESLYRRVAEEMKLSGEYWKPTWDGQILNHKPPLLFWFIALISTLVDGATTQVSIFSARLPGLLASIGMLFGLYGFSKRLKLSTPVAAPLFFCSALFPVLTATSAIFDPIQTFLLLPTLFIPTLLFFENREPKKIEWFFWSLSLFLATAFKGLNGIVVPSVAYAIHLSFNLLFQKNFRKFFLSALKFFGFAFLPALAASALYYWFLDLKMGRAFTTEFFFVHHFGRSSQPMEAHGGSFLYHPFSVFLGAGFLAPVLIYLWLGVKPEFKRYGFPLSYALAFIFIFSFSATKLPHYTWPVWPALALAAAIAFHFFETGKKEVLSRGLGFISSFPVFVLGILALFLAINPLSIFSTLHSLFDLRPSTLSLLKYFDGFSVISRLFFAFSFLLSFSFLVNRSKLFFRPALTALLAVLAAGFLVVGLVPSIKELWIQPLHDISKTLVLHGAKPGDCIRYNGPHSPTLSLAMGNQLLHNRGCEPSQVKFLIAQEWKLGDCEYYRLPVLEQRKFLYLCARP